EDTIASIERNGLCLKAPLTTPVGSGYRSINVYLRQRFKLYVCLRPFKLYPGVRTRFEKVDLVVVRENMEDLYAGIEYRCQQPETRRLIDFVRETTGQEILADSGISLKPISETNSERIIRFGFEYALRNRRRKVTAVHKANIMKYTDGLFLEVARRVASQYPQIEFEDRIVDNMAMQLVQKPELYDVLVCPNLYGDILSDLCAGLVGGLGFSGGANIGEDVAIFEATHGSAPKYKGQNKVNPSALLLAAILMLEYMGEAAAARRLEQALADVVREGKYVTYDLKEPGDSSAVGTREMGEAILSRL
ncbi:MAG TPA: isocitrate/isopropylmalate family dehydrogenase, partial [bacterium]|nr:isocitrate/isopropylmalate family dehydrogenase [bacterium]